MSHLRIATLPRTAMLCLLVLLAAGKRASAESLPTDPSVVSGELENGLRYMVRKHGNPPGRAAIWMHMDTGSLNETDQQRGLAHYLEHMAFNGSTNFPPGSVVPFFESLGMTFGRDQNAFTNMGQTTYQLYLPDTKTPTLTRGLGFFADVLHRLLLAPTEIDAERQIIQEERRRGLSGRQRANDYLMDRLTPGSLYSQRETIGTEASIDGLKPKDFRDYYDAWYTASNATLMVVADADPAEIVRLLKEAFGSAPKKAKPSPQASGVKGYEKSFALVASDPEIQSEDVRILRMEPAHPPTTTFEGWRDDLVLTLGQSAFNRRVEDRIARGGTHLQGVRASSGDEVHALHSWSVSGRAMPGQWKAALEEMALELVRARKLGFTARELEDAKRQIRAGAERAAETEATAPAQTLVSRMNSAVTAGEPLLGPAQVLDLLGKLLPTIKPEEVTARFAREFDPAAVAFVAILPAGPGVPTEAQLLEAGTKALAVEPTREAEVEHAARLMKELPKAGTVLEGKEHAASRVWSGWLSNGVRVHHRFMDERKNEVSIHVSLLGGELLETAANRGVTSAAQVAWSTPATKSLTSGDVRELTTGKKVAVRGGGGGGGGGRRGRGGSGASSMAAVALTISGSPEDLEAGCQLAYLLLTEPKIEEAAFEQFRSSTRQTITESQKNPLAMGQRLASSAPYPESDVRLQPVTVDQLGKLTLEASQAWLEKLIKESPIEVAIVGDIPREKALELAARYLASLPARARVSKDTYTAERTLVRPKGPRLLEKLIETPTAQAFVLSGFYGADDSQVADVRALTMAARVLTSRMTTEVREKAQLVYSIGASSRAAVTFPGFGVFAAGAPTEPHKARALVSKLASMYEEFAAKGPEKEEMEVVRKQTAKGLEEQDRDPGVWMGRLELLTFRNTNLDDIVADAAAYQALDAEAVKKAFASRYSKESSIVVLVEPAGTEAAKPADPKPPEPSGSPK